MKWLWKKEKTEQCWDCRKDAKPYIIFNGYLRCGKCTDKFIEEQKLRS
jgi:hypothetical protein